MYLVTIVYNQPSDPEAFDDYYAAKHRPLVDAIPDVQQFTMAKCDPLDGNPPAAYALAQLAFESKEQAGQALASGPGQAAAADVANFATGGITLLFSAA
ncbi:EthD family reductase [Gordonia rhizosphera]|uniref:EthD domain-containing protein n=1 Tax=Gordonia rhizosphera NBRC 16068 TaxID=1108045 RepID=K6WAC7_9ACTN|nr:EthD family reductase [Gordonia rhizosphera]GAB90706.1 hypothetical protein GORHZ_115_00610 [Gordonia rhizosphera NBRC 16068]